MWSGRRLFLSQENLRPIKLGMKHFFYASLQPRQLMKCTRTLKTQNMVSFGQVDRVLSPGHSASCFNIRNTFEKSVRFHRCNSSIGKAYCLAAQLLHNMPSIMKRCSAKRGDLGEGRRYPQRYCRKPADSQEELLQCPLAKVIQHPNHLFSKQPFLPLHFPASFATSVPFISSSLAPSAFYLFF